MNKYTCQNTFTSPQTGKTYKAGDVIDQYEYDRLSYSDSKRFAMKPSDESFAYQSSQNYGLPGYLSGDMFNTGIPGGLDMDFSTPY